MSLSDIRALVKDKNVLLVGNNLTALQIKQGTLIDSYDIVVRFGKGLTNGREDYLGYRTDIWVTGGFRKTMRKYLPKGTKVLYNSSILSRDKVIDPPDYPHTVMYSLEEIDAINAQYGQTGNKRLSAGAVTAHWFYYVVGGFKSISFINFDFFHSTTKFLDVKHGVHNVASSWHLPIAIPKFAKEHDTPELHPAHDLEVERKIFDEILSNKDAFFIGELPDKPRFVNVENAAWDNVRQKIED